MFQTRMSARPRPSPESRAVQFKLSVSTPGDPFELEADRVAELVTSQPAPAINRCACQSLGKEEEEELPRLALKALPTVQRCPACEAAARRKGEAVPTDTDGDHERIVRRALSSGGNPMDDATRTFMETRFGHSFANVRIHSSAEASRSAESLAARAYTVGSDVAFRSGEYQPNTSSGKRLLAHELTHVIQQGRAPALRDEAQRSPLATGRETIQRDPWDLEGHDAPSCKEKIAEDAAVCADHVNTACTAGGATIAGTGALIGAGVGMAVTGPAAPAGAAIGGLIGFGAGVIGGVLGYGKCVEVANAKCRALGRERSAACDEKFPAREPVDLGDVDSWPESQQ